MLDVGNYTLVSKKSEECSISVQGSLFLISSYKIVSLMIRYVIGRMMDVEGGDAFANRMISTTKKVWLVVVKWMH